MTSAPGDHTRLFLVEQGGAIRIFDLTSGALLSTPFLTIAGIIISGGEQGLLGMAFDPDYGTNGRFYVHYTDLNGDIVIARYERNPSNPNLAGTTGIILQTIPHPFTNHNGGMLAFGPDGCLYAGPGDGGSANDPDNHAQNPSSRLGKLLRLNPQTGGPCSNVTLNPFLAGGAPEVWSIGLRNPWRFSFDRRTGDLYIADVGQSAREEINVVLQAQGGGRGVNYGWRCMEGTQQTFNFDANCAQATLNGPVLDYPRTGEACAITGGYVYRGSAIPALDGTYFYADFCAGFVRSFRFQNGQVLDQFDWPTLRPPGRFVTSFGEDAQGELYILTQGGGLWRIAPN
ncbi:PQQ-dependent sugar dehydrogenase [Nitrospira moscoviensis]|nr:PQQ-dependent sugar dehydrogenase [Nitrospira moscoviensis]